MKMQKDHYLKLKSAIEQVLSEHTDAALYYSQGEFHNADRTKDLQRRFCFDLLWAAKINDFVREELYPYLNDEHIYTALKRICPKIERNF